MELIFAAIAIFALAALVGAYLLSLVLREQKTPKIVTLLHGTFAVTGLILLVVYYTRNEVGPLASIIVFATAALGGLVLFYTDITGKPIPKWLAVGHGVIALTGFALLLAFAF